jgi:DNA-binding GntR family transcriptional regulator
MRRAALASFAFEAAALSSRADKSVRVIETAIETSMLRCKGITAANRREAHASHGPGPLVSEHQGIADALAAHDGEAASSAMRDHVMILSDDALQLSRNLRL